MKLPAWLGAAQWLPHYNRETAARDSVAAVIVTIMLIPQSLAYAMLAGLPPASCHWLSMPCSVPAVPWRWARWR